MEKEEVKVKIRRVADKEPATTITYPKGDGMEHWHSDPAKSEFEVAPLIAHFAVREGFFEEVPEAQQTKLKPVEKPA